VGSHPQAAAHNTASHQVLEQCGVTRLDQDGDEVVFQIDAR
jgi:hypothetical protein